MSEYVSPELLKKQGFVIKDGLPYRMTLIERYYSKGWLEYGDKRIDSGIRLDSANQLAADFYYSRFPSNAAIDWQKERVDGGFNKAEPEPVLDARNRFFKAIRSVPREFWPVVQDVVLYETRPDIGGATQLAYKQELYRMKVDLCRGLDRLAWHYGVRPVRRKIQSMAVGDKLSPIDKPRRYTIELDRKKTS